ncbi:MAG: hypothetical protein M4579_004933 [Chaenotheca gracillima]|nr:MAG: hypothetical protein M4579_004933 [Chaenotheca gracillima]
MTAPHPPRPRRRSSRPTRASEDPVAAEYDIYLNAQGSLDVYLCQYPTRSSDQPLTDQRHAKPSEIRIKPRAGLVEVDVPMNPYENYDTTKGVHWGEAARKSNRDQAVGAQGLSGGFGVGSVIDAGRRGGAGATGRAGRIQDEEDGGGPLDAAMSTAELTANFERAVAEGRALNKITYGGKMSAKTDASPIYMIGAFRGKQVHLTPVKSIVQLTPQFHHIDAASEQELTAGAAARNAARGGGEEGAAAVEPKEKEAKAVQMSNKPVIDGEEVDMAKTVNMLKAFQEENWLRHPYEDENSASAWTAYDKFFLFNPENAPRLKSQLSNEEYLDVLSGSHAHGAADGTRPRRSKKKRGRSRTTTAVVDDDDDDDGEESEGSEQDL